MFLSNSSSTINNSLIPTFDDVWPILKRLGCHDDGNYYYLPQMCSPTCKYNAWEGFDPSSLRCYICKHGLPRCVKFPPVEPDDEDLLRIWVRYAIVPFASNEVSVPNYGVTTHKALKKYCREILKIPHDSSGTFVINGKKVNYDAFLEISAREGINLGSAVSDLDHNELCRMMLFIAETDIPLYAYCEDTNHCRLSRRTRTVPAANVGRLNCGQTQVQHQDQQQHALEVSRQNSLQVQLQAPLREQARVPLRDPIQEPLQDSLPEGLLQESLQSPLQVPLQSPLQVPLQDPLQLGMPPLRDYLKNELHWNTLGRTRVRNGVFSWGDIIGWREGLGRAYYSSFTLRGGEFRPGDFVLRRETDQCSGRVLYEEIFQIVAAFQAMKSWVGNWNSTSSKNEIQRRGYCYLELQQFKFAKGYQSDSLWVNMPTIKTLHLESVQEKTIPCCFISRDFSFRKVSIPILLLQNKSSRKRKLEEADQLFKPPVLESPELLAASHAACGWDVARHAVQVQFVKTVRKGEYEKRPQQLPIYYDDDSSGDESDGISDKLCLARSKRASRKPAVKTIISKEWFPPSDPLPQIVVSGLKFNEYSDGITYAQLQRDREIVSQAISTLAGKYENSNILLHEIDEKMKQVRPLSDLVDINPEIVDNHLESSLQTSLNMLGFKEFRHKLQHDVCLAALESPPDDVTLIAPCGFGKTLCFLLPAIIQGGITLVIEPLRALVENLTFALSGSQEFDVVALRNSADSRRSGKFTEYADTYLGLLGMELNSKQYCGKPLLLFATAELINKNSNLGYLEALANCGALRRIVIDEFDVIEESTINYRETYLSLVPNIRDVCPGIPFMFFSGTTTKKMIFSVLDSQGHKISKVYMHNRALPDNLIYSVERKQDKDQVARRIVSILGTYVANCNSNGPLKVLCFCLTPENCKKMKNSLLIANNGTLDMMVEIVTGRTNESGETSEIVEAFQATTSKSVHILCATKALGRGFHADDIRFIFHTNIPLSPSDYIQETGRAGRDGVVSYCILFFRDQDCWAAENVTNQHGLAADHTKFCRGELEKVVRYCRAGDNCRYSILASYATVSECHPWEQKCRPHAMCDNCSKNSFQANEPIMVEHRDLGIIQVNSCNLEEVTGFVHRLLAEYDTIAPSESNRKSVWRNFIDGSSSPCPISSMLRFGRHEVSLSDDLYCFLKGCGIISPEQSYCSAQKFAQSKLRVFIKHHKAPATLYQQRSLVSELEWTKNPFIHHVHSSGSQLASPATEDHDCGCFSFLLQFEIKRMQSHRPDLSGIGTQGLLSDLQRFYGKEPPYHNAIRRAESACQKVDSHSGTYLFFSARIPKNAKSLDNIELLPPEVALDRRIFRKFGSHRFLHINVPIGVPQTVRNRLFMRPFKICGRVYSLLWVKQTKSPQVYILFAEKGVGIDRHHEISSRKVLEWCLCPRLNPEMSLGKLYKRMKLWFSKTSPSGLLPQGSVEVVPDIKSPNGAVMTDGCGLVSPDALQYIWDQYWQDSQCPNIMCTSFQGRLGGFKGTWVLSKALGKGIKIVCTMSQQKFDLPMKSLIDGPTTEDADDFYDTMEVCKWNSAMEDASLNNRLIQCLESRAYGENAKRLVELLQSCVNKQCQWLADLKDHEKWLEFTLNRYRKLVSQKESSATGFTDTEVLFRMSLSDLDPADPAFARRKKRFLEHEFKNMRKKGHYPMEKARYVWMFPDFSGLLEEGEAFLALADQTITSEHVLALRSPSYFARDLRKLRLVGMEELLSRQPWENGKFGQLPLAGRDFLFGLQNALILSTKGMQAEADKMSGGDYDGDICWVSWNEELVALVEPSGDDHQSTSISEPQKSELEQKNAWDVSLDDILMYVYHHREHQKHLGLLANLLDKAVDVLGFDNEYSYALGQEAFLQVDHPYYLCRPEMKVKNDVEALKYPHWMEREQCNSFQSTRALGILWDVVENNLIAASASIQSSQIPKPDRSILACVQAALDDPFMQGIVLTLRSEAQRAIDGWLKEKELLKFVKDDGNSAANAKRDRFLEQQQKELILKHCHPKSQVLDRSFLAAAVLYEQAHLHVKDKKDMHWVQDIAWKLGLERLSYVVTHANSGGRVALPVPPEYEKTFLSRGSQHKRHDCAAVTEGAQHLSAEPVVPEL